ncbi:MAG: hypothetical protein JW727_06135 [Candidatus Aenigmarchaeota archaeon]|nr:hypothetical protein [Candidatus Aenigmarchaeota archaeon]
MSSKTYGGLTEGISSRLKEREVLQNYSKWRGELRKYMLEEEIRPVWGRGLEEAEVATFYDNAKDLLYSTDLPPERIPIVARKIGGNWKHIQEDGIYLSCLINNCKDSETITLEIPPSGTFENQLAQYLSKNIFLHDWCYFGMNTSEGTIKVINPGGNILHDLGYRMSGGKIILEGNASVNVGQLMTGGEITVNGNTGHKLGNQMKGGRITVNGKADDVSRMKGGHVLVEGDAHSLGRDMSGGEILVKGNLLVSENAGPQIGAGMTGGKITIEGKIIDLTDKKRYLGLKGKCNVGLISKDFKGGEIYLGDTLIAKDGEVYWQDLYRHFS